MVYKRLEIRALNINLLRSSRFSFLLGKVLAASVAFVIVSALPIALGYGLFIFVFNSGFGIPLTDIEFLSFRGFLFLMLGVFMRMVLIYSISLLLAVIFATPYRAFYKNLWVILAPVIFLLDWLVYVVTPDIAARYGGGIAGPLMGLRYFTINYLVSAIIDAFGYLRIPDYSPLWPKTEPFMLIWGTPFYIFAVLLYLFYLLVTLVAASIIWGRKDL